MSHPKTKLILMAAITLMMPLISVAANADSRISGVWTCEVVRPANLSARPIDFTFHADGIAAYSSQTNINVSGDDRFPFNGRGGGHGMWRDTGKNTFKVQTIEHLYIDGNAGGRFLVDLNFYLNTNNISDPQDDQLCTGSLDVGGPNEDLCPVGGNVRLTQYEFALLTDPITFEADQFSEFHPVIRCDRFSQTKAYGKDGFIFPIPASVPIP